MDLASAKPRPGGMVLGADGAIVETPEHLLAAIVGRGITDAIFDLEGPELPILDGSAAPWLEAIDRVGIEGGPRIAARAVRRPCGAALDGGRARLEPAARGELRVEIGWDDPRLPRGAIALAVSDVEAIAAARTFVLAADAEAALAAGRGRGATPENTILVDPDRPVPLRYPDEVLRHKALDALGDLALVGAPFQGRLVIERGSHRLHAAILEAWRRDDPGAALA